MRKALITAVAAGTLVFAASAQAAKGTYAGTVTNTTGKIALDVKIQQGFVTKVTRVRGVDIPSQCEVSGQVTVHHDFSTKLTVKGNGRFRGSFTQPTYGNVSTIAGRI